MHTPAAAFAWELWRRHRARLITIIGLVLGFALVYPKLCAQAGFNPDSPDALDEFGRKYGPMMDGGPTPFRLAQFLYLLFLVGGPATAMFLSLLCVTWMFTFIEFDPKATNPMTFPGRIFTLPVSTSFLFWWLLLGGLAAVVVLFESWVYFVPLPHLDIFGEYQKCLGWMTLMALAQGIVWALAAWPITRLVVLIAVLFCFVGSVARRDIFESPIVLPTLFLAGAVLARVGLQKMRHGQWQGWTWKWPLPAMLARAELRGPKRFASRAQAQLWFEWRRFARNLCFFVAALAIIPVLIHLLARVAAGYGPLENNTLLVFTLYLAAMPLFIHFCFAASPGRTDQSFLMIRPLTEGDMATAVLKAAAVSTAFSWVAVFAALGVMPLLGNFRAVERSVSVVPECRATIVVGLIFLTWRVVAVNLCFARSGNRWLAGAPVLALLALWAGVILFFLDQNGVLSDWFRRVVPFVPSLLACLVAVKLLLAFLAFRVSLKRGLLTPSVLTGYLAIWILLVAALLTLELILPRPPGEWLLPLSLGIVLLVPLARIAFCPIALARSRHT
jgi:hypothetical protein